MEFASLLPIRERTTPFWLAERVRRAFEASSHPGQRAIRSTVSVGIAISDEQLSDLSALLNAADQALYRAKVLGRNRVEPLPHWAEERSTKQRNRCNLLPTGSAATKHDLANRGSIVISPEVS